MAGLGGLKKGDRPEIEAKAEGFIGGAKERIDALSSNTPPVKETRKKVFERYTFSLNPSVSDAIDNLSLQPREFKVNRSEVVRVAIEHLSSLPESQIIDILQKSKK